MTNMLDHLKKAFSGPPDQPRPVVTEVPLRGKYRFQYENFVIATQREVYLLLKSEGGRIDALRFDSTALRYGGPNDEARGGHPLAAYGLGFYGLYVVENSPWIHEQMCANRVHPRHDDTMFADRKHYVACFMDVTVEVTCRGFEEIAMSEDEVNALVQRELTLLE